MLPLRSGKAIALARMGKMQVDHRIVVRDQDGHIVSDQRADDMAAASPLFEAAELKLLPGQTAALQHGARIICKSS